MTGRARACCLWLYGAALLVGAPRVLHAQAEGEPARPVPLEATPASASAPAPAPAPAPASASAPAPASASAPAPAPASAPAPSPEPASEPAAEPESTRRVPEISVRLDPLNWLLHGLLAIEAEVAVWKFLSAEVQMRFQVGDEPPLLHYRGLPEGLRVRSNGAGPLAGFSLGAAAWLSGKPFQGYVVRAYYQNTGLAYESVDEDEFVLDRVEQTERRLGLLIGSHSRFGHFTIGGALGFEYEINSQSRCFPGASYNDPSTTGCGNTRVQQIALDPQQGDVADLNGLAHPIYFVTRLTVGAVF